MKLISKTNLILFEEDIKDKIVKTQLGVKSDEISNILATFNENKIKKNTENKKLTVATETQTQIL